VSKGGKKKFSTYPHSKHEKPWKNIVLFKVIHIIHIKTCVFGGLLFKKKRTDVLLSYDEFIFLSKKSSENIDF